jgi:hypothetical protein
MMAHDNGLAGAGAARSLVRLSNEALEQTRPAVGSTGAVLAAQRRCSPDTRREEDW